MYHRSLDEFISLVGWGEAQKCALYPFWEELRCSDFSGFHFLWDEKFIQGVLSLMEFPDRDNVQKTLWELLPYIRQNQDAQFYLQSMFYLMYCRKPADKNIPTGSFLTSVFQHFEAAEKLFGARCMVANLLILFGAAKRVEQSHRALQVPDQYTRSTIFSFSSRLEGFQLTHGYSGCRLNDLPWTREYADGRLFRIGRFNFLVTSLPSWMAIVYRHRRTHELRVLCRHEWQYPAKNGKLVQTYLTQTEGSISGVIIPPSGRINPERRITLDKTEWEAVVSPWDLTPSFHIGKGTSLFPETLKSSFQEAKVFFRDIFHMEPKMFIGSSWILDFNLQKYLADSNIGFFQRQFYLRQGHPIPRAGFSSIFGRSDGELDEYPQKTRLQRALVDMEKTCGIRWSSAFILASDVDRIGENCYQTRYADLEEPPDLR